MRKTPILEKLNCEATYLSILSSISHLLNESKANIDLAFSKCFKYKLT